MYPSALWCAVAAILVFLPVSGTSADRFPQEETRAGAGLTTRNPLDEIKDELVRVLSDADVPFTSVQEDSITPIWVSNELAPRCRKNLDQGILR